LKSVHRRRFRREQVRNEKVVARRKSEDREGREEEGDVPIESGLGILERRAKRRLEGN
jgi:hypothetical protein